MNKKSDQSNVNTHLLQGLFRNVQSSNKPHKETRKQYSVYVCSLQYITNNCLICKIQRDKLEIKWI